MKGVVKNMKEKDFQAPYNDLMGDILKKHTEDGGMDNLPGEGKPLSREYFSKDTFQHFQEIAKDAGYKPHWLNLQQEITDEVLFLADSYTTDITLDIKEKLKIINQKLLKYNRICPPPMQRGQVSLDTIKDVLERKNKNSSQ